MAHMDTSFEHSALLRRLEQARDAIASRLPHRRRSKVSQSSAEILARYQAELDKAFRLRRHVYGRMYPRLRQGDASLLVDAITVWERHYNVDRITHLVDPLFYSDDDRVLLANDGTIVGLFDALVEFIYHSQADEETVQRCRTIRSAWASSGQDYCDFWRRIPEYERKMALSATLLLAESLQEERRLEPFFLRTLERMAKVYGDKQPRSQQADPDRVRHELEELEGLQAHVAARRRSLENARQALHQSSANEHSLSHPLLNQPLLTRKARIYGMV
ncbi:hypothetical protein OF846_005370 [Rhodotorula toruloides]|nr:hypothetical protein OF846_005370 [Rhodotorula toruloides]